MNYLEYSYILHMGIELSSQIFATLTIIIGLLKCYLNFHTPQHKNFA